jgi:hypothetical protein
MGKPRMPCASISIRDLSRGDVEQHEPQPSLPFFETSTIINYTHLLSSRYRQHGRNNFPSNHHDPPTPWQWRNSIPVQCCFRACSTLMREYTRTLQQLRNFEPSWWWYNQVQQWGTIFGMYMHQHLYEARWLVLYKWLQWADIIGGIRLMVLHCRLLQRLLL